MSGQTKVSISPTQADSTKLDLNTNNVLPEQSQRYPKSFLKLILFGFSLVGLPLTVALINSALSIDELANQSRDTIYKATQTTYGNRVLVDQILTMERSVRQASILKDMSLLEGYFRSHADFEKITKKLVELPLRTEQQLLLEKLRLTEATIFKKLLSILEYPDDLHNLTGQFSKLMELSDEFSAMNQRFIGVEVSEMLDMATHARTVVEWQLLALIPFAILLALIFSFLLTRPIRQIDDAINKMGQGELSKPVHVTGPQSLIYLGERLDWMRRRLLKLQEQKNQFLRHISHELKTPLTAIREGTDLLAEGITGKLTEKQQLIANILHSSSVQLQKRIEDLLNYSAIQTEKTALVKKKVNLVSILNDVLEDQNLSIMTKHLKINQSCQDLTLECDAQKIKIILDNLISNAVKFSPMHGSIDISGKRKENKIQLDFIDAGVGIHNADQDKIFEPFYQGRSLPSIHPVKGTGLGLSIAREYALAHGGNIALIKNVNAGTQFRLTLPISDQEESQ